MVLPAAQQGLRVVPGELEQCYMLLCNKPVCYLLLHKTECYLVSWRSCVCLSGPTGGGMSMVAAVQEA